MVPRYSRATGSSRRRPREAFFAHDGKRFFRTGDLGYYDDEGYFFITDRLKRMINCSGFKVWPAEVEAMLYAHPGDPGGLRHRLARRLSRRNGEGADRAEERAQDHQSEGNHRVGA